VGATQRRHGRGPLWVDSPTTDTARSGPNACGGLTLSVLPVTVFPSAFRPCVPKPATRCRFVSIWRHRVVVSVRLPAAGPLHSLNRDSSQAGGSVRGRPYARAYRRPKPREGGQEASSARLTFVYSPGLTGASATLTKLNRPRLAEGSATFAFLNRPGACGQVGARASTGPGAHRRNP